MNFLSEKDAPSSKSSELGKVEYAYTVLSWVPRNPSETELTRESLVDAVTHK